MSTLVKTSQFHLKSLDKLGNVSSIVIMADMHAQCLVLRRMFVISKRNGNDTGVNIS